MSFNCTISDASDTEMLAVRCHPPSKVPVVDLLCAVDCVSFQPCYGYMKIGKHWTTMLQKQEK